MLQVLKNQNRIEWVDIFKGLTIISVVIGHSTGMFNMYIYQFHMAAFFFISGFTTDLRKRSLPLTVWNKSLTILLPFVTIFAILLCLVTILDKIGFYNFLFKDSFVGLKFAITQMVTKGNIFINWMGATWFIIVLFEVVILQKVFHLFWNGKVNIGYVITTMITFLIGYYMVRSNARLHVSIFPFDLLFIAQFYFGVGIIFKEFNIFTKISGSIYNIVAIGFFSFFILYLFGNVIHATVDYPSRNFKNPVTESLAAINGVFFIYVISVLIVRGPKFIRTVLTFTGQNTLGIVFFHFMFFKITFWILYLFNLTPLSGLQNFIPPIDLGRQFWWLFTLISIALSILLWRSMIWFKPLKLLLGDNKEAYSNAYNKLNKLKLIQRLKELLFGIQSIKIYFLNSLEYLKRHYISSILVAIIIILTVSPMVKQGVICNDELQFRFERMSGFSAFLKECITDKLHQGRPLIILSAFNIALSFPSQYMIINRIFQIGFLLVSLFLFGYFTYKLFGNKRFSLFLSIFILVFLPITFEHAVPNAFMGLTCIPMSTLLLSFIFYLKYLDTKKQNSLFFSMILFFISMLGYEFIITFVLIFPLLFFAKTPINQIKLKYFFKINAIPLIAGMVYIGLFLLSQAIFQNGYKGAQMGFVSLKSSFEIIFNLFKSVLPGYFIFNPKYEYLFFFYSNLPFPSAGTFNFENAIKLFKYLINSDIVIRLLFLIFSLALMFKSIFSSYTNETRRKTTIPLLAIIVGIGYMILPSLPISIAKMYQGNVNSTNFTSLPTSYFLYFAVCFSIASIIWIIYEKSTWKFSGTIITLILCIFIFPVQIMNSLFSNIHQKNYSRLVSIENLFQTNSIKNLDKQIIYAPDLYKTKNLLAIHDGYWQKYAKIKGVNSEIHNTKGTGKEELVIYYQNDEYFVLSGGNEVVVLSGTRLKGQHPVKVSDNKYLSGNFSQENLDGSFFSYRFRKTGIDKDECLEADNSNKRPFRDIQIEAGNSLSTANIHNGIFPDGWLGKSCELEIKTGTLGKIIIKGYFPNKITGNETGLIYVNEIATEIKISTNSFIIELNAPIQKVVTLKILNNFSFVSPPDIRKLSFLLSDIEAQ